MIYKICRFLQIKMDDVIFLKEIITISDIEIITIPTYHESSRKKQKFPVTTRTPLQKTLDDLDDGIVMTRDYDAEVYVCMYGGGA